MTDITNNTQYLTGNHREDETMKDLIDNINQIVQDELIDCAEDIEIQSSILTATGIWLDLFGKRLNFPRPTVADTETENFGFDDAGVGFDQAPFAQGGGAQTPISDELYRTFLIARGGQLLTDGSIPSMDAILDAAFGVGIYIDNADMTLNVVINGDIDTNTINLMISSGLLTKPAGVKINSVTVTYDDGAFGFDEGGIGFDQAPFANITPI